MRIIKTKSAYKVELSRFKHPAIGLFALTVTMMVLFSNPLWAQPIQVDALQELAFGSFATGSTGGTIEVSPQNSRSVSGTVIGLAHPPVSAAVFEVSIKGNNKIVHFYLPELAHLVRLGGIESMTITNFTSDKPGNSFITTSGSEIYPVNVGATLNIQNSTVNPPGNYSGTFTVTFIRE